jgi:hypothetical protein
MAVDNYFPHFERITKGMNIMIMKVMIMLLLMMMMMMMMMMMIMMFENDYVCLTTLWLPSS